MGVYLVNRLLKSYFVWKIILIVLVIEKKLENAINWNVNNVIYLQRAVTNGRPQMSNFAMGTILGKGFPQALRHSFYELWTVCTCACGKPFPKIVPMAKLDILNFVLYSICRCILKKQTKPLYIKYKVTSHNKYQYHAFFR